MSLREAYLEVVLGPCASGDGCDPLDVEEFQRVVQCLILVGAHLGAFCRLLDARTEQRANMKPLPHT